jgi:phage baseplate assembly protein W
MDLAFPLRIAAQRRLADTDYASHVRDMIEQLIFTNPGERVNRPDFGSGLYQLIFAPNSPELAATIEFTMLAALQRYLGDIIDIAGLEVTAIDDALAIMVAYRILATDEQVVSRFLTGRPP